MAGPFGVMPGGPVFRGVGTCGVGTSCLTVYLHRDRRGRHGARALTPLIRDDDAPGQRWSGAVPTREGIMGTVPNKPKTPSRNVRVDDELWAAALRRAAAEGLTVSDVIRDALREYVERPKSRRGRAGGPK